MKHLLPAALAAFAIAALATAASAAPPTVRVTQAWIRALPGGLPAAGYFTLTNTGNGPVTLVSASSSACGMLMLHRSESHSGVSQMTDVTKVDVAAGQTLRFAPGGYHLMCTQPAATLTRGANVPVTLHFSDGSQVTVPFAVRSATGQ